jgi:hypothetical protein
LALAPDGFYPFENDDVVAIKALAAGPKQAAEKGK